MTRSQRASVDSIEYQTMTDNTLVNHVHGHAQKDPGRHQHGDLACPAEQHVRILFAEKVLQNVIFFCIAVM